MKLTGGQITQLLRVNERVEFKRATSELPDNLWETYSAFCNTDGGTITFSNPGTMRISKSVSVAGGTSDARNTAIFNIFALVDIGERSGMGLANLHGLWKKYGCAEPKITESYDPDRTVIVVTTDDEVESAPEDDIKVDNNAEGNIQPDDGKEQSERKLLSELPASCRQVLKALSEDGSFTQQVLMRKLNLSRAAITKAIVILIKERYIIRRGARKNGYWEVLP
ncbi:MAG: HTH domain-containing protein [Kiritimatiellae bacterium]|nr:HTH domain-containing protein [Kiritimatiellia bacterium]